MTVGARSLGKYAVLSHRWVADGQEVIYDDPDTLHQHLQRKNRDMPNSRGVARRRRAWIPVYLDPQPVHRQNGRSGTSDVWTSISAMFAWYWNADVCVVYLAGTVALDEKGMEERPLVLARMDATRGDSPAKDEGVSSGLDAGSPWDQVRCPSTDDILVHKQPRWGSRFDVGIASDVCGDTRGPIRPAPQAHIRGVQAHESSSNDQ